MIHNYNRYESASLSKKYLSGWGECRLDDTHIIGAKSANYHVLRGSAIPAVLIEVGFLSNAQEEQLLKEDSYRQRISEAIHDGVVDFARSENAQDGRMASSR